MGRRLFITLLITLAPLFGCGEIQESWEACAEAVEYAHLGDAEALCGRFSEKNPYGTWTVKLALNGKELEAFPFEVVR